MSDLQSLLNVLYDVMTMPFTVFGLTLSWFSVFMGCVLISLVMYAVIRLFL